MLDFFKFFCKCKTSIDAYLYAKLNQLKKLPILVYKNKAFPDEKRIIKELDKIL